MNKLAMISAMLNRADERELDLVCQIVSVIIGWKEEAPALPPPLPAPPPPEGAKKLLPRMRTLPQAVKEIQEKDPHSCITLHALRRWVKSGEVPSRKAGKNFLVDLDEVGRYIGEG